MDIMERAYDLAAVAVRRRFAEQHPDRLAVLDSLNRRNVAVYSGTYDHVEEVLARLGVPFWRDPNPRRLAKAAVAFANCSAQPSPDLVSRAEGFVRDGGWLVSSDWSLTNVVQVSFPNTVRRRPGPHTGDEVVAVEPDRDSLWSEVVVVGADPQWWLETSSHPIEIIDPQKVRVEAASHELLVRYDAPAVSVRFDWHRGHVFHVISHFWMTRTRTPPRARYAGPSTDFLKVGMRLSDEGIEEVLSQVGLRAADLNFAAIQSAATSTELVAQLCIRAARCRENPSWLRRLWRVRETPR